MSNFNNAEDGDRISILIVDDEKSLLDPLQIYLRDFGYQVDTALNSEEAYQLILKRRGQYDVILLDQTVRPGDNGIKIMQRIKVEHPDIECIIFTGWDMEHRQQALREGAFRYLEKPFDKEELALLIRTAAQQVRLRSISRSMVSENKLDNLLKNVISSARSLVFADDAAIFVNEQTKSEQKIFRSPRADGELWNHHTTERSLSKEIIARSCTISVPDIMEYPGIYLNLEKTGYRSFVGLPIPGEGKNLGVLYVYSKKEHQFDENGNTAILRTMASQAGLAILNIWAREQLTLHNRYMEALVNVSRGLSYSNVSKNQLELTWDFVRTQLGVSTFFIGLYDPLKNEVYFPLYYDEGLPQNVDPRSLANREAWGASGYVIKTGEELIWRSTQDEQNVCRRYRIKGYVRGQSSKSCFFLPLKIDNEVIGVISIQSYTKNDFQEILLDAFRALANQLSAAIKNTRLFESEAHRANEAETLRETTLVLSSSLDIEQIIKAILKELHKVVAFDYASVQMLNEKNGLPVFEIRSGYGFPDETAFVGLSFPVDGDNPNREVYKTRKPVRYADAPALFSGFRDLPHAQACIHGWLGIPMLVGDKMIGMISLDSQQKDFYTEYHERLAMAFASQAAVAIDNARHHQSIERSNRLLKTLDEFVGYIRSDQDYQHLAHQTVRLAAELVGWSVSALFSYNPHLKLLTIDQVHQLPIELIGKSIVDHQGKVGLAATTGKKQYATSAKQVDTLEDLFAPYGLRTVIVLPVKYGGQVEQVLLIGDRDEREVKEDELEILDRFTSQASIALQTSNLIATELKRYKQFYILQKINEFIEVRKRIEFILHVILTGLTAGYGLGFNRAAILMVGERGFVGKMAIGHTNLEAVQEAWEDSKKMKLNEFDQYLQALEGDKIQKTPLEIAVVGTCFDVPKPDMQKMLDAFENHPCLELSPDILKSSPLFLEVFQPTSRMVIAPIKSEGLVIGIMVADNKFTLAPFTDGDKDALLTFANVTAVAIENRRMLEEILFSQERLEKTQKAAADVAQVMVLGNLEDTLITLREAAKLVFDCSMFTLYVYNNKSRRFTHREHFGSLDPKNINTPEGLTSSSLVWKVLGFEKPYYWKTSATQTDELLCGNFAVQEKVQSTLVVKLHFNSIPLGAMFINFRQPHEFRQEEIDIALFFAEQAAIAIQNAQSYEQTKQISNYQKALYEAGKAINSTMALNDLLDKIANTALALTAVKGERADLCNILLEEGGSLYFANSVPKSFHPRWDHISLASAKIGVTGRAYKDKKSIPVEDVTKHEDYLAFVDDTLSELAVPILIGDKQIGIINVESKKKGIFDQDDLWALEHLASIAAVAIQNSRMFEELQKSMRKVASRSAVAWMGMSATAWRHTIDKHAVTIMDYVRLIEIEQKPAPDSELAYELATIKRLAKQILEKPITPPLSTEEGIEPVLINNFVQERVNRLWDSLPYKTAELILKLEVENSLMIHISPEWLRRAFDLIIENAAKALKNCDKKLITVGTRMVTRGKLMIYVMDTGQGFPLEILDKLGKEYINKGSGEEGLGMGLLLAETIAETFGGEVQVISPGPGNTTVAIMLPVNQPSYSLEGE